jgi:hypothetical protein
MGQGRASEIQSRAAPDLPVRYGHDRAITALAGHLSELRACAGYARFAAGVDFRCAADAAKHLAPHAPLEALKGFLDRATMLLEQNWPHVEIIADALMTRRTLTGTEVEAICGLPRPSA